MAKDPRPPLAPCPFCGGKPIYVFRRTWEEWFVACTNDACRATCSAGAKLPFVAVTAEAAANKWNQRFDAVEFNDADVRFV